MSDLNAKCSLILSQWTGPWLHNRGIQLWNQNLRTNDNWGQAESFTFQTSIVFSLFFLFLTGHWRFCFKASMRNDSILHPFCFIMKLLCSSVFIWLHCHKCSWTVASAVHSVEVTLKLITVVQTYCVYYIYCTCSSAGLPGSHARTETPAEAPVH